VARVRRRSVDAVPVGKMPHHISIQPGKLYPQPGYTLQIDKEGKWTATQIFLCHRSSAVALMPRPDSSHPDVHIIELLQVPASSTHVDPTDIPFH